MIISRKLVEATFQGVAFTNDHPQETASLVAHHFRKSPEEVLDAMRTSKYLGASD